ncbi:hypothetical protein AwEntero_23050 [Enterobacterales bacterium]|nr:hypothetical protein AwEntero_23050 [Enterobacterales bacterium]
MEETGLTLGHIDHGPWGNDIFTREQKHYVTLFCIAQLATGEGEPENREPEKCEGWQWFDLHDLPQPLFLPLQNLLEILGPLADSRILIEQCGI